MKTRLSPEVIYYWCWCCLHLIVTIISCLSQWLASPIVAIESLVSRVKHFLSPESLMSPTPAKLPNHISLVINENRIDVDTLVGFVSWCQRLHIPFLSVYVNSNNCQAHLCELQDELLKAKSRLLDVQKTKIGRVLNGHCNRSTNEFSNQILKFDNIIVKLLSKENSKKSLVKAAQSLSAKNSPSKEVTEKMISTLLHDDYQLPDPDMLIGFGATPSLFGYPPWQIRLTEMFFLPTHCDLQENDFFNILSKYSKCQQRFGV